MMVLIDGAHIRAAHGYQSRHIDVTVGKSKSREGRRADLPWRLEVQNRRC